MGKSSGGVRGVTSAELGAVTVGNVYDYIGKTDLLGAVASRQYNWEVSGKQEFEFENERKEVMRSLKPDTLAYKIVKSANSRYGLSEKQRWAVAYGLMGSTEFKKKVAFDKKRSIQFAKEEREAKERLKALKRGKIVRREKS